MAEIIYKEESYKIIGICMEIHRILGKGFLENVYKDAIEYEFKKNNIEYSREVYFNIKYKDEILPHKYIADFIVYDKIILEVKCAKNILDEHLKLTLNYLAVTNFKLGLIVNFYENSLNYKRVIL